MNRRAEVDGRWRAAYRRIEGLADGDTAAALAFVAALALYYLTPWPAVSLLWLLALAALAWLRLDVALALLPLTFPYWYVPKRVIGHTVFPLSEIVLAICIAAAVAREARALLAPTGRRRLGARPRGHVTRLGLPLIGGVTLFALGGTLGVLVARRPHEALRAYRWEIVEPLLYLALLLCYVRGPRALRRTLWAFLGSALVVAVLAFAQVAFAHVTFTPLASGNRLVPITPGADRATGIIYGSGNSLGAYLARAFPLALALAVTNLAIPLPFRAQPRDEPGSPSRRGPAERGPPARRDGPSRRERIVAALLCLAYLPALYWSASRGAWVATVVAATLVICLALGRPWLLAALAALGALAAYWQRGGLIATALAGHNGSGAVRTLLWLAAWHMIRDHPLLGVGLDQFLYYYSDRYTNHPYWITTLNGHRTLAWREPTLAHPHNLALDLWLSIGLLGLAGFVAVLGALWWRCLRLWRDGSPRRRGWARAIALGVAAATLASLLHGMVDSAYFVPDLALTFWWGVAVVLIAERTFRARAARSDGPPGHATA